MGNFSTTKYLVSAAAAIAIALIMLALFLSAPKNFPENTLFTAESGKAASFIADDLKEGGIIRSRFAFKVFAILFSDGRIVAGDYFFDKPISILGVVSRLARGDHRLNTVKVTIPEGFTAEDISRVLAEKMPDFDRQNFLNLAQVEEGYLFPDTYFFYPNYKAERIIGLMKENFDSKIAPYQDEIKQSGHSLNEIITMASLIEKESGSLEDKVPISSILWRRISIDLALQVDVALETYDFRGLPVGPIANPGLDSILAALRPVKTPYLFYIHAPDGTAYYAEDFEEHKANRVKYLNE